MTSKLIRSMGMAAIVAGVVLGGAASAAAQTSDKTSSLAGTWQMSLIGDHVIPVALVLEQSGTALKGTFTLMGKDFPLTGEVAGGKVTLSGKGPAFGRPTKGAPNDHEAAAAATAPKAPVQVAGPQAPGPNMSLADMTISGVVDADGAMAGNIVMKYGEGTGTIKWSAERFKERAVPASQMASSDGVNVTGSWKMAVVEAGQLLDVEFKQDGSKITGTAKNDHLGTLVLDGTFASGTMSFTATGSAQGQPVKIEFSGKYLKGGTFAGEAQSQMGTLTWTAERVKK